jgi:hypothetical protein
MENRWGRVETSTGPLARSLDGLVLVSTPGLWRRSAWASLNQDDARLRVDMGELDIEYTEHCEAQAT